MHSLFVIAALAAVCLGQAPDLLSSNKALLRALDKYPKSGASLYWRAVVNDICLLEAAIPRPTNDTQYYLECINLPEEQQRPDLGQWVLRKCKQGNEFVPYKRRCLGKPAVRRAQVSLCGQRTSGCQAVPVQAVPQQCGGSSCGTVYQPQPTPVYPTQPLPVYTQPPVVYPSVPVPTQPVYPVPSQQTGCQCPQQPCQQQPCPTQQQQCGCPQQPQIVQPQPCPLAQGSQGQAQENGICSWMLDPLKAHQDPKFYLQCQPAPGNEFCGRWRKMCCAPGTIFNEQLQVCAHDPNAQPGQLGPAQQQCGCQTGQAIGQCGQNYQCPGQSVCQVQPQQVQQPQQPQQQQCPNTCCYLGAMLR